VSSAINNKKFRKRLPMLVGGGLMVVVTLAVVMLIKNFMADSDEPKKRRVQQISLIKPPEPPPPEVKPPEEKPPEIKEEIPHDQPPPEPTNTDQPPPGIGGAGYGSGDSSFGGSGGWMGGSGRFGYYLGGVQKGIHEELNRNEKLRKKLYKIEIALWIAKDGLVSRFELLGSSGDKELDVQIKKALFGARFEEPPSDIPQPIKLRISSR
jgi:protein TonB